jgi:ABC-type lipoprotein release transport system permease subunit
MNTFWLGLRETVLRWRTSATFGGLVAIPMLMYLLLSGYQAGLEARYLELSNQYLVIQESGSMGEFYGSRLQSSLKLALQQAGYPDAVPQINTVTGLSPEKAVLLRGVELGRYQEIETFRMIAGRPLLANEKPRAVMIGVQLARQRNVLPGGLIDLRGRDFKVVGIFENGTFADFEAWISLTDAQNLLGWGSDVSLYIIPDGGRIQAGDEIQPGISAVRRGESGENLVNEWRPFFGLLRNIIIALTVAVMVSLIHTVWRIAWQRKRDLAILISTGFSRTSLFVYLLAQGFGITLIGVMSAAAGAWLFSRYFQLSTAGISIKAVFTPMIFLQGLTAALAAPLVAAAIPARIFQKMNVVELMKVDG